MNKQMKNALLLGASLAIGAATTVNAHAAKKDGDIKCKGVAMMGKNDCGANGHGCGGMSNSNNKAYKADPAKYMANEWVYMSKADCKKAKDAKMMKKKKKDS